MQIGIEIRVSIANADSDSLSASIGLLVRLSVVEAGRKPILPPQTENHGHELKNTDGLVWSPYSPCFLEKFGHL